MIQSWTLGVLKLTLNISLPVPYIADGGVSRQSCLHIPLPKGTLPGFLWLKITPSCPLRHLWPPPGMESHIANVKAHSLSKKFCTMICFSKNEQLMSALAGWKGLVRMICFSKNEDRAELFTQWMDFNIWFVKQDIQKWLKTKIYSFLWRIWKWTEKGQKIFWPFGAGIWTKDFQ